MTEQGQCSTSGYNSEDPAYRHKDTSASKNRGYNGSITKGHDHLTKSSLSRTKSRSESTSKKRSASRSPVRRQDSTMRRQDSTLRQGDSSQKLVSRHSEPALRSSATQPQRRATHAGATQAGPAARRTAAEARAFRLRQLFNPRAAALQRPETTKGYFSTQDMNLRGSKPLLMTRGRFGPVLVQVRYETKQKVKYISHIKDTRGRCLLTDDRSKDVKGLIFNKESLSLHPPLLPPPPPTAGKEEDIEEKHASAKEDHRLSSPPQTLRIPSKPRKSIPGSEAIGKTMKSVSGADIFMKGHGKPRKSLSGLGVQ